MNFSRIASRVALTQPLQERPDYGSREFITQEQMEEICPECAEKMASIGITKVSVDAIIRSAVGLPKGWTESSAKKWWNTVTKGAKHKKTKCMKAIEGKVDNPGAFCKWLEGIVK